MPTQEGINNFYRFVLFKMNTLDVKIKHRLIFLYVCTNSNELFFGIHKNQK